jgi:hypothetical protein
MIARAAEGSVRDSLSLLDQAIAHGDLAAKLSVASLTRAWQILLKGLFEVRDATRPISACEMVLIRLAHAADLPPTDKLVKDLLERGGSGDARQGRHPAERRGATGACCLRRRHAGPRAHARGRPHGIYPHAGRHGRAGSRQPCADPESGVGEPYPSGASGTGTHRISPASPRLAYLGRRPATKAARLDRRTLGCFHRQPGRRADAGRTETVGQDGPLRSRGAGSIGARRAGPFFPAPKSWRCATPPSPMSPRPCRTKTKNEQACHPRRTLRRKLRCEGRESRCWIPDGSSTWIPFPSRSDAALGRE